MMATSLLVSLIIMGGGWYNAAQQDTNCGNGTSPACNPLFYHTPTSTGYNEGGFGAAYWVDLTAAVTAIVAIVASILGSQVAIAK